MKKVQTSKLKSMAKWLEQEKNRNRYYGDSDDAFALDVHCCPVSLSYLRQHLRSNGYATRIASKRSRWLLVYKK